MVGHGPYRPLEERLGSREAFEAFQKSEAERTARVLAHRRKVRNDGMKLLGGVILILAVTCAVIYFTTRAGLP